MNAILAFLKLNFRKPKFIAIASVGAVLLVAVTAYALTWHSWKPASPETMHALWKFDPRRYRPLPQVETGPPWPVGFSRRQVDVLNQCNRVLVASLENDGNDPGRTDTTRFHGHNILSVREYSTAADVERIRNSLFNDSIALPSLNAQAGVVKVGVRFLLDRSEGQRPVAIDMIVDESHHMMFICDEQELRHCQIEPTLATSLRDMAIR